MRSFSTETKSVSQDAGVGDQHVSHTVLVHQDGNVVGGCVSGHAQRIARHHAEHRLIDSACEHAVDEVAFREDADGPMLVIDDDHGADALGLHECEGMAHGVAAGTDDRRPADQGTHRCSKCVVLAGQTAFEQPFRFHPVRPSQYCSRAW
jgi:hypothetical protein